MTDVSSLLRMQIVQLRHDELYHKDVVIMPFGERVKHMALHMAKYTGALAEALDAGDDARIDRVLTDAFIITLATANTLNQDLGREMGNGENGNSSLAALGFAAAHELGRADDRLWLLKMFARYGGALAKACESLDHLESFPFRDSMRESNLNLFKLVLAEASARQMDLEHRYEMRLQQVEARSIFNDVWRSTRPEP